MISCDECRKKMAAVFDNEASEADESVISAHLEDCPECRAFRAHIIKIRQALVSAPVPAVSFELPQECMRGVEANSEKSREPGSRKNADYERLVVKFQRLAWIGGLAASFLVVVSWLACFVLAGRVRDLRHELQAAQQDLVLAEQDAAVARTEGQSEKDRAREQKAITALYLRMAELERRIDRSDSPRPAYFPAERNGL